MRHCGQKPPIDDPRDSNDDDNPCLRVQGHGHRDESHLMYDQFAKEFCFWKVDYGCGCPVDMECGSCIETESISIKTMITQLKDDFNGEIPQEVLDLIEKHKKEMTSE